MKSFVCALALVACLAPVAFGASLSNQEVQETPRGGWGSTQTQAHGWGSEVFSGSNLVLFAPVVAVFMIGLLWIAAYSTIRDAPPNVGYNLNAGGWGWDQQGGGWSMQQGGGWGQQGSTVEASSGGWAQPQQQQGGWGWDQSGANSVQHASVVAPASAGSSPVPVSVPAPANMVAAAASARNFNDLTKRVLSSIEK